LRRRDETCPAGAKKAQRTECDRHGQLDELGSHFFIYRVK